MARCRPVAALLAIAALGLVARAEAGKTVDEQLQGQLTEPCISTPAEYKAAFEAREPRCVAETLFGRIAQGPTVGQAQLGLADRKLAYFFSGNDALEKYLRIGYPEIVGLGAALVNNNATGLTDNNNGMALLAQIGYPLQYADISQVYVLHVMSWDTLNKSTAALEPTLSFGAGVTPLSPDWDGVRAFFEYVYERAGLNVSDAALAILKNTSFAALTGCPEQCAYFSAGFPSKNATTPVITQPRVNGTCPPPRPGSSVAPPSAVDEWSDLCNAGWKKALAAVLPFFPRNCTAATNGAAGAPLAALINSAASPLEEALLFRAAVFPGCAGGFNSLFSGDGYTYTGYGGLLAPLGSEFIVSPFNLDPAADVARIPFCISGTNAGKPNAATGACDLPTTSVAARRLRRLLMDA